MPFSNADQVFDAIEGIVTSYNFTLPGRNRDLGMELAYKVADGIHDRSIQEQRGASSFWAACDAEYVTEKFDLYKTNKTGERTGQMLSILSLVGQVEISEYTVYMTYGIDAAPTRSKYSGYISDQDKSITDAEKAEHFSAKRPFYELDEVICQACVELARDELIDYMTRVMA